MEPQSSPLLRRASSGSRQCFDSLQGVLWDICLLDSVQEIQQEIGVEDVNEEGWLMSRRMLLERKVAEVKRESQRLTTSRVFGLVPDHQVANLRDLLREPVTKDGFVCAILQSIVPGTHAVSFSEEELTVCAEELFFNIDSNGNGSIDWSELTHYIVNSYDARSDVEKVTSTWCEVSHNAAPAERCKRRRVYFFPSSDKIVTIDSCRSGTVVTDHGILSVYIPGQCSYGRFKPYGVLRSEYTMQSAEWVPRLNQLVVSTANAMLRWFHIKDMKDETHSEIIQPIKHNSMDVAQLKLTYDEESDILFCGDNRGTITGIRPDSSLLRVPEVQYSVSPHAGHPVADLLALPTIGAKKIASCGLDARCLINDVETGRVERDLVRDFGDRQIINTLSYSKEFSLLATGGLFDCEPSLWTPLAGQFISQLRDIEEPHKGKIMFLHCVNQDSAQHAHLSPWHTLSADSLGMVKVWDLRRAAVVQTFWLTPGGGDGVVSDPLKSASQHLDPDWEAGQQGADPSSAAGPNDRSGAPVGEGGKGARSSVSSACLFDNKFFDVAIDTSRGWLVSALRTDTERLTKVHKRFVLDGCNPKLAHDDPISFVLYSKPSELFLTVAGRTARLWDARTGTIRATYLDLSSTAVTAVTIDNQARRFVMGCHDGALLMRTLITGGVAATFRKAPGEITSVFESSRDVFVVLAAKHLLIYKYAEDHESVISPSFVVKMGEKLTCSFFYPEVSVYGLGDASEGITIIDTHTKARAKTIGICRYEGILHDRLEEADVDTDDIVQQTEHRLRGYLHPTQGEVTCMAPVKPYPMFATGDLNGYVTLYTLRPHHIPYKCCARWRLNRFHKGVSSPPLCVSIVWDGSRLYTTDDHGCVSSWNIQGILKRNGLHPTQFPFAPPQSDPSAASMLSTPGTAPLFASQRGRTEGSPEVGAPPAPPVPSALTVMQAVLERSYEAHRPMTCVSSIVQIEGTTLLATCGADARVLFWDPSGDLLGQLQQGNAYQADDTPVPSCFASVALRIRDAGHAAGGVDSPQAASQADTHILLGGPAGGTPATPPAAAAAEANAAACGTSPSKREGDGSSSCSGGEDGDGDAERRSPPPPSLALCSKYALMRAEVWAAAVGHRGSPAGGRAAPAGWRQKQKQKLQWEAEAGDEEEVFVSEEVRAALAGVVLDEVSSAPVVVPPGTPVASPRFTCVLRNRYTSSRPASATAPHGTIRFVKTKRPRCADPRPTGDTPDTNTATTAAAAAAAATSTPCDSSLPTSAAEVVPPQRAAEILTASVRKDCAAHLGKLGMGGAGGVCMGVGSTPLFAVSRRPKLPVFEPPSIASALRSPPSAETDWKTVLLKTSPNRNDWIARCIHTFTPAQILTAPASCGMMSPELNALSKIALSSTPREESDPIWGGTGDPPDTEHPGTSPAAATGSSRQPPSPSSLAAPRGGGGGGGRRVSLFHLQHPVSEGEEGASQPPPQHRRRKSLAEMVHGGVDDPLEQAERILGMYRGKHNTSFENLLRAAQLTLGECERLRARGGSASLSPSPLPTPRGQRSGSSPQTGGGGGGGGGGHPIHPRASFSQRRGSSFRREVDQTMWRWGEAVLATPGGRSSLSELAMPAGGPAEPASREGSPQGGAAQRHASGRRSLVAEFAGWGGGGCGRGGGNASPRGSPSSPRARVAGGGGGVGGPPPAAPWGGPGIFSSGAASSEADPFAPFGRRDSSCSSASLPQDPPGAPPPCPADPTLAAGAGGDAAQPCDTTQPPEVTFSENAANSPRLQGGPAGGGRRGNPRAMSPVCAPSSGGGVAALCGAPSLLEETSLGKWGRPMISSVSQGDVRAAIIGSKTAKMCPGGGVAVAGVSGVASEQRRRMPKLSKLNRDYYEGKPILASGWESGRDPAPQQAPAPLVSEGKGGAAMGGLELCFENAAPTKGVVQKQPPGLGALKSPLGAASVLSAYYLSKSAQCPTPCDEVLVYRPMRAAAQRRVPSRGGGGGGGGASGQLADCGGTQRCGGVGEVGVPLLGPEVPDPVTAITISRLHGGGVVDGGV